MSDEPWLDLREIEGVQHCHGTDCDEYFYRPVVYGDSLFTYVAHIPPHGGVRGDQGESDMFEMSLYVLDGEVTVTAGAGTPDETEEKHILGPHVAMHFPKGKPYGIWNERDVPASLVLSFTPPPKGAKNPREMREFLEKRGRSAVPPNEMNAMAGRLLAGLMAAQQERSRSMSIARGIPLKDAFGIQHADDEFWYRPLVLGRNLFSYVAHIPSGGGVPPYPDPAQQLQIEHSMYVLSGTLEIELRGVPATLVPHTAVRIPPGDPILMHNPGPDPVSIYMAYTPSPWGAESPIGERRMVTTHEEMLGWMKLRERKVWSPAEMNAMGGDLAARVGSLAEYRQGYLSGQKDRVGLEMSADEPLWTALWEADGYQHWHRPDPPDEFWFRPLVCGDKHLTYVGHIPPGGGVAPSPEEAEFVEMCIYTLSGELGCSILENGSEVRFVLPPHHALHAPKNVPLGFWNPGEATASFILTFTPNAPDRNSVTAFRNKAINEYGWTLWQAGELNKMVAGTLRLPTE